MDENNQNDNSIIEQTPKKLFFKDKKFWLGIAYTFIPFAVFTTIMAPLSDGYGVLLPLILVIPYAILGIILWAAVRTKNKSFALGLMIGCLIPLAVMFVLTGGCGLLSF